MSQDESSNDGAEGAEVVGDVAEGVGKAADAASKVQRGDVAGAVGSGLGAAGSTAGAASAALREDESEARDAVRTASSVASTATSALAAGRSLASAAQSGQPGQAAGGLSSATDATRYVVPDNEAQQVLDGVGRGAGTVGGAAEGLDGVSSALGGGGRHGAVSFHIEMDGLAGPLEVRDVQVHESLSEVGTCRVVFMSTEHVASSDLLRKECRLMVERVDQVRTFGGIVQHASVRGDLEGTRFTVRIVPALWYLSQMVTSRVHQNTTVPDLVVGLVDELLGMQRRSVRDDTTATYQEHEYLVQYEESYLDFVSRLCEQEGVFWYFDHSEEPEVMVLADAQSALPAARDGDSDEVPYIALQTENEEGVHTVDYDQWVGPTDAVISGFDWTRPWVPMGDARTGRSDQEPALELYDHTDALTYHGYQEPAYGQDTASIQVQTRAELLDLGRQDWLMGSTFIGARPGHVFELVNCLEDDLNDRYMIVSASSGGAANGRETGTYGSSLKCVPTSLPYRPERRTPRPVIPGLETATVVTDGQEIQTDVHGRVKVQFHWDRLGENDERSSCWLRVVQNWAGEGFGTFFLPRKDMEVVVGFLGGNPDRPIITGCVYNGANPVPAELDAKRTQSVIRTKSSPNSDGFNEIRFEDDAGSEFINVHAEKDLNEIVEHCHTTHVKVDQSNTVDHDDTETVGNDQTLHVKNDRKKIVDNDERTTVGRHRTEEVTGHEQIHIHEWRKTKIEEDEKLVVHGDRKMVVQGRDDEEIVNGREVVVTAFDNLKVEDGANRNVVVSGQYNVTVDGAHYTLVQGDTEKFTQGSQKTYLESAKEVHAKTGSSHLLMKNDGKIKLAGDTKIELEVGGCKIEMTTQKITLTAGSTSIELGPSGATVSGQTVTSSAKTLNEITGLLVKIN